jgi:hypothetical protein
MDIEKLKEKLEKITYPRRQWNNPRHKLEAIPVIGLVTLVCDEDIIRYRCWRTVNGEETEDDRTQETVYRCHEPGLRAIAGAVKPWATELRGGTPALIVEQCKGADLLCPGIF